uniref:Endoplasmic reticulum transmembrane protein n=1 Tax=Ditylenchus dipsaci TaxID=166011 RepID=A0A915E7R9_9BILA
MTLQWTVIAYILYGEIGTFVPPLAMDSSNFVEEVYSYAVIAVLLLLFFDATREVRKYSGVDISTEGTRGRLAEADSLVHMRLFRAQRNLYISGFALLLFLVINRIVGLLARSAHLEAAAESAMKQAEGASKAAKTLLEADDGEAIKKGEKEREELLKKLKAAENDRDAMKAQSKNLQKEYDRVCSQLNSKEGGAGDKKDD